MFLMKAYLARYYAKLYPDEMFIGVAGPYDKATYLLTCAAVLGRKYKILTTEPGLDAAFNIPSTILKLNPKVQKVILELAAENPNQMDYFLSFIRPTIAILTNTYAHNQTLGDIDSILKEISKLTQSLSKKGVAIISWDDPNSRKLAKECPGNVMYYGLDPKNCTVWAGNVKVENFITTFELNFGVERVKVNFKPLGFHQVYPALAAALLGIVSDIPLTTIKLALEGIDGKEHELQPIPGPNGSIILDDTYSSPGTVSSAIDTLLAVSARRRIIVLGEMKESGHYSDKFYQTVAQRIYKDKLDVVFLGLGEDSQIIAEELRSLGFWEERLESNLQNSQLVAKLLKTLDKGDVCLIKGSKSVRLDEVVKRIAKKT